MSSRIQRKVTDMSPMTKPRRSLALGLAILAWSWQLMPYATPSRADEAACFPQLEENFQEAKRLFKRWEETKSITLLTDVLAMPEFDSAPPACRTKVYELLAQSYNRMKNIELVREAVEDVARKILTTDPEFNFEAVLDQQELLEIVNRVRASMVPPPSERSITYAFAAGFDANAVIEAPAGKTKRVKISIVPKMSRNVFALDSRGGPVLLDQLDSVTAAISYTPSEAGIGTKQLVVLTATNPDTTMQFAFSFLVTEKRSNKTLLYIGGGVVVAAVVALVAGGGGGGGGDGSAQLPDYPPPPKR